MNLQNRINLFIKLSEYFLEDSPEWQETKRSASNQNPWFTSEFIELAITNIRDEFLDEPKLKAWISYYHLDDNITAKKVGIVMAGNIPLVGFHDFLCAFLCGHKVKIKLSSKDQILLKHIIGKFSEWYPNSADSIEISEMLKGCDAYIATGSNNSARYFDFYFGKYPSIIRRNRTSVAVIKGAETEQELENLSDDIHSYFGLGCRNVTKIFVPDNYDFVPLLRSFKHYEYVSENNKYRNNYDYNLSIQLLNHKYYMTNETTLLIENESNFSPIGQLNYSYYSNIIEVQNSLRNNPDIQCIVGIDIPFGKAQHPSLFDYADGIDTMQFLLSIP
jgi:hypothetical protein